MGRNAFDDEVKLNEKEGVEELEMSEISRRNGGDTLDSIDS